MKKFWCDHCGKLIDDPLTRYVIRKLQGKELDFCNQECAYAYLQRKDNDDDGKVLGRNRS